MTSQDIIYTNVVHSGVTMIAQQAREDAGHEKSARISVSFPRDVYETIERLAKEKKVSVAWIVRDAAERYIADQWPLLESPPIK